LLLSFFSAVIAQTDHQSTGTITASASQVEVGESFKITVQGSDSDGLWGVGYLFNNTPVWEKGAASKTWTLSETTPGSYTFYGMVAGRVAGTTTDQSAWTSPKSVTVTVVLGLLPELLPRLTISRQELLLPPLLK